FNPCTAHHRGAGRIDFRVDFRVEGRLSERRFGDRRAPGRPAGSALRRAPRFLLASELRGGPPTPEVVLHAS
ncbi:MAG TPA: hypothetical protein VN972_04365, partial [Methylomirabilota bacterium]|nr:hypothetical protein [Methylomirabilota bacterium]